MAGSTRDKTRLFELIPGEKRLPMKREEIAILLEEQLGKKRASAILAVYPTNRHGQRSLATDASFGLPTIQFATRHAQTRPWWLDRFDATFAEPPMPSTYGMCGSNGFSGCDDASGRLHRCATFMMHSNPPTDVQS